MLEKDSMRLTIVLVRIDKVTQESSEPDRVPV